MTHDAIALLSSLPDRRGSYYHAVCADVQSCSLLYGHEEQSALLQRAFACWHLVDENGHCYDWHLCHKIAKKGRIDLVLRILYGGSSDGWLYSSSRSKARYRLKMMEYCISEFISTDRHDLVDQLAGEICRNGAGRKLIGRIVASSATYALWVRKLGGAKVLVHRYLCHCNAEDLAPFLNEWCCTTTNFPEEVTHFLQWLDTETKSHQSGTISNA